MTAVVSLEQARRAHTLAGALLTDIGNGERLIARHGENLHFHVKEKRWYLWDEARWKQDTHREIERLAKETLRALLRAAADEEVAAKREQLVKHAIKSEANGKLHAMIDRAGAEAGIAVMPDELDAHHFLLNCRNGVVDLTTGDLKPHDRALLLTKLAPVHYDETAACPAWLKFLDRIFAGDAALIAYIQRAVGYSLTGDTREQCLHLLHGTGANGKSTFLELLADLFGDYAMQADFTSFLEKKQNDGPRNDLARLNGARLVRSSEIGEGKRFNEALIKTLTGSERISARFLYAEAFEFDPTFKLWFAANHKPVIRGTDHAIWRRVRLIPFTVTIPDNERDEHLPAALRSELSGILTWAVQGALEWRANGLRPPESVMAATAAYRTESDVLGAFLEDACEFGQAYEVTAADIYHAYSRWASEGGEYAMSQTAFGRRLEERGIPSVKRSGAKWRRGLRLSSPSIAKQEELY